MSVNTQHDQKTSTNILMYVSIFATVIAVSSVYMTQPLFARLSSDFEVSVDVARHAFDIPMIAYALAFFLIGPLTDRSRASILGAVGAFGLAAALTISSFANNFNVFVLMLSLSGIFAAIIPSSTFTLVPRMSSAEHMGTMFGVAISASVVGITIGRSFAGIASDFVGWRTVLQGTAALSGLCGVLLILSTSDKDRPFIVQETIGTSFKAAAELAVSRKVIPLLLTGILLFSGYLGILTFLTFRLGAPPFSASASEIGWISLGGLVAVVGAPISGWIAVRSSARGVALGGLSCVLAAIFILWSAGSMLVVLFGLLLLFAAVFACQPAVLLILSTQGARNRRGMLASLYTVACLGSGGLASIWLGPIWRLWSWDGVSVSCAFSIIAALVIMYLSSDGKG